MKAFRVHTTDRLEGRVSVGGCKNTTLKTILAFPHVASGELSLRNASTNSQTRFAIEVLEECGATHTRSHSVETIRATSLNTLHSVFESAIPQMRHFSRMAVAMVTHGVQFRMPQPGYSPYGPRPFKPVADVLELFGIEVHQKGNLVHMQWKEVERFGGRHIMAPVVAACRVNAEACMAAAVARKGRTTIINMAQDPDIWDLAKFYSAFAPVRFTGLRTPILEVESEGIDVGTEYRLSFDLPGDYLEAATLAAAVIAVGGDVWIEGFDSSRILPLVPVMQGFGASVEVHEQSIHVVADGAPKAHSFQTDRYPGFPTDAQGPFLTVAALAKGHSLIRETIWTNRLTQAPELNRMGASIDLLDNQTASISPVQELYGCNVVGTCPRSTAGLIIAGMKARGETLVSGVDLLRNAYGKLEENLAALGARLSVVDDGDEATRRHKHLGRLEAF